MCETQKIKRIGLTALPSGILWFLTTETDRSRLFRMEGQALRVAMAAAVDLRPRAGAIDKGVVRRHRAGVGNAQQGAPRVVKVLRTLRAAALAGGDKEGAVAPEDQPRAEVPACAR